MKRKKSILSDRSAGNSVWKFNSRRFRQEGSVARLSVLFHFPFRFRHACWLAESYFETIQGRWSCWGGGTYSHGVCLAAILVGISQEMRTIRIGFLEDFPFLRAENRCRARGRKKRGKKKFIDLLLIKYATALKLCSQWKFWKKKLQQVSIHSVQSLQRVNVFRLFHLKSFSRFFFWKIQGCVKEVPMEKMYIDVDMDFFVLIPFWCIFWGG